MALEVKKTIEEQLGCREIRFWDTTGAYNPSTNPTGYGDASTVITADITKAIIYITPYGWGIPFTITFNITNLVITGATILYPDGTNKAVTLDYSVFPFTEASHFKITGELLGYGEESEIPFGHYIIDYEVYVGTTVVGNTGGDYLITCQVDRATKNALGSVNIEDDKCCNTSKMLTPFRAQVFLDSAKYSMENSEPYKAQKTLEYAYELAIGKCKIC